MGNLRRYRRDAVSGNDVLAEVTRLVRHIHVTLTILLVVAGIHLGLVTATIVSC